MAEVRVGDIVVQTPQFARQVSLRILQTNAFYNAGIVATNPVINQMVASGLGNTIDMPHYNPIDVDVEPYISNDDPNEFATPQGLGTGVMRARKIGTNQHWKSMNFVPSMNGRSDPLGVIAGQIADYWSIQYSRTMISSCVGVYLDNVANDGGDMVYDGTAVGDGTMSAPMIIRARQTKGDRKRDFTAIGMHSDVYANLEEKDLITFVKYSGQNTLFPTYNGLFVIEDDDMPRLGANYLSILYGPGAMLFGSGEPKRPFSNSYDELTGNGAGAELLHSRREYAFHPNGWNYTGAPAAESATRAELETAAAWERVYDRKRVNMAFILTTG